MAKNNVSSAAVSLARHINGKITTNHLNLPLANKARPKVNKNNIPKSYIWLATIIRMVREIGDRSTAISIGILIIQNAFTKYLNEKK